MFGAGSVNRLCGRAFGGVRWPGAAEGGWERGFGLADRWLRMRVCRWSTGGLGYGLVAGGCGLGQDSGWRLWLGSGFSLAAVAWAWVLAGGGWLGPWVSEWPPPARTLSFRLAAAGAGEWPLPAQALGLRLAALGSGWRRLAGAMGLRLAAGGWAVGCGWQPLARAPWVSDWPPPAWALGLRLPVWVSGSGPGSRTLAGAHGFVAGRRRLGPMGLWLADAGLGPWVYDWRPLGWALDFWLAAPAPAVDSGLLTGRWGQGSRRGSGLPASSWAPGVG
jgi:hypothetical protein